MAKGMLLDGFGFFFEFFFFFGGIHFLPVVGNFEYDRRQQKESDQIRDSHQGIQGIGDEPQAASSIFGKVPTGIRSTQISRKGLMALTPKRYCVHFSL